MLQGLGSFVGQNAGSIIGAAGSLFGTGLTNSAQTAASKKQMEFQRYMSNTAYRRAAKDLEKAGLNRVLALGSPASTPQGAQPALKDLGTSFSSGFGSGSSAALLNKQATQVGLQNFYDKKGKEFYNSLPKVAKDVVNVAILSEKTGVSPNLLIASKAPQTKWWKELFNSYNYGKAGSWWRRAGGAKGIFEKMGSYRSGPDPRYGAMPPKEPERKKRTLKRYGNVSVWSD